MLAAGLSGDNVREALRAHFKPEFLNRIDDIITFKSLGKEEIAKIIDIQLDSPAQASGGSQDHARAHAGAREALFQEGYDPSFGARPLKRAIQKLIADQLALKLLSGEIQSGEHIEADVSKTGEFVFNTLPAKAS